MSKPRRNQRDDQARPSPSEIADDGFKSPDSGNGTTALALLSLRIGLHAYFKTYQSVRCSIAQVIEDATDEDGFDKTMSGRYCEAYAETVVHLQHFLELTLKDVLRSLHPLLALEGTDRDIKLQYKLLANESLESNDYDNLKSVSMSDALSRTEVLSKIGVTRLGNQQFSLTAAEIQVIKALNELRNRAWHRGAYSLNYSALDRLMGWHLLPLLKRLLSYQIFQDVEHHWKCKQLACGIDPMDEVIREMANSKPDYLKGAAIKEMGRAAYENPLARSALLSTLFDPPTRRRAAAVARIPPGPVEVSELRGCPVCGIETLQTLSEGVLKDDDPEDPLIDYWQDYELNCTCCSFRLSWQVGDLHLPTGDFKVEWLQHDSRPDYSCPP